MLCAKDMLEPVAPTLIFDTHADHRKQSDPLNKHLSDWLILKLKEYVCVYMLVVGG